MPAKIHKFLLFLRDLFKISMELRKKIAQRVGWLFEEGEEGFGEGLEFLVIGDTFEGETEADKALGLGNGGTVAIGIGENGKSLT